MKYILTTNDGDVWEFDSLEEARKNKYIFGGKITVKYEEAENYINSHQENADSLTYLLELMGFNVVFDINSNKYKIKG